MNERQMSGIGARDEWWLMRYYFVRTAFSALWVALAFSVGQRSPEATAVLLFVYPAWDALANYFDMSRSGGMTEGRTQAINAVISVAAAVAVIVALNARTHWVLGVFGVWAILSGLLQLGTAVRRWNRFAAQWAMALSGVQSALAGAYFIVQARAPTPPAISRVAAYAAVGAIYFLVSALWLYVRRLRRETV